MPLSETSGPSDRLPERPEDSRFLLGIPDAFDYEQAAGRIYKYLAGSSGNVINAELVSVVKNALHLEGTIGNREATVVILNAIAEARAIAGFPSPELFIASLQERRARVKALFSTAEAAPKPQRSVYVALEEFRSLIMQGDGAKERLEKVVRELELAYDHYGSQSVQETDEKGEMAAIVHRIRECLESEVLKQMGISSKLGF